MRKLIVVLAALVGFGVLGLASTPGVLTVVFTTDPPNIDPAVVTDYEAGVVTYNVYEGLLDYNLADYSIKPALATSWEIASDGMSAVFTLREGVKFHDGTPFNADAVKYSIERVQAMNQAPATYLAPITKIEVYQHRWQNNKHSSVLAQTIACEEFQELGGVKVPTVFRVTNLPTDPAAQANFDAQRKELEAALAKLRAAGQDAAAKEVMAKIAHPQGASSQVVRLTEVKVNYQPEAEGFKIEMPKDWAVRDLDAQPKPNERRAISNPVDPSQENFGRNPIRRGLRE